MKSSIKVACWLIVLNLTLSAHSQSVVNSAYNLFGIGTLEQSGLSTFESMGYAAIGSRPVDIVNLKNPAGLNSILGVNQVFDVGVFRASLGQSSGSESFSGTSGGLRDLNYWFRVSPRTALTLGTSKFSEATYNILDSRSRNNQRGISNALYLGEGGSSSVYVGAGYQLSKNLSVGAKANFLFSSINRVEILSFDQLSIDLEAENKSSFTKALLEAGLQYTLPLRGNQSVTIGGIVRTGGDATVSNETTIRSINTSADSLSSDLESSLYIPQKVGIGVGFNLKSWIINLDYESENWGQNEDQVGFQYQDRFIGSVGFQFIKDRYSTKLIERMSFRFGSGIHSNYISVENEDYLSQYYSFGIGLPISRGAAALNFSYQYYNTGTSENNLISEQANTLSVNFAIRGIWFKKRGYD